jgi:hypothetical protein
LGLGLSLLRASPLFIFHMLVRHYSCVRGTRFRFANPNNPCKLKCKSSRHCSSHSKIGIWYLRAHGYFSTSPPSSLWVSLFELERSWHSPASVRSRFTCGSSYAREWHGLRGQGTIIGAARRDSDIIRHSEVLGHDEPVARDMSLK